MISFHSRYTGVDEEKGVFGSFDEFLNDQIPLCAVGQTLTGCLVKDTEKNLWHSFSISRGKKVIGLMCSPHELRCRETTLSLSEMVSIFSKYDNAQVNIDGVSYLLKIRLAGWRPTEWLNSPNLVDKHALKVINNVGFFQKVFNFLRSFFFRRIRKK